MKITPKKIQEWEDELYKQGYVREHEDTYQLGVAKGIRLARNLFMQMMHGGTEKGYSAW